METVEERKLLILGGNYTEKIIVERAQKHGYYTIVTDNHKDWTLSPAKQIADEGWDVSWADIDELEKRCVKEGVQGVLAGFSEFRVENMIRLCDRLNLPCSLTIHQLDVTRNKELFKQTCRTFGIQTVRDYQKEEVRNFPVIVKPVDRAGSIGINIARNHEELDQYFDCAMSLSPSKRVIIEDYIEDGTKFDVYYYVKGEDVFFLGSSDTIMCKGETGSKILQKCWPFKSKYEQQFLSTTDGLVRKMFKGLGIKNAYATLSAFYQDGVFKFFETGFRLSGEMSFNYYDHLTGVNYVDSMIRYAMGDADESEYRQVQNAVDSTIVLNFFLTDGKVGRINALSNDTDCITNIYVKEGDVVKNDTDVLKKGLMVTITVSDLTELYRIVSVVNENIDVLDTEGNSMIYERVSESELDAYYKS